MRWGAARRGAAAAWALGAVELEDPTWAALHKEEAPEDSWRGEGRAVAAIHKAGRSQPEADRSLREVVRSWGADNFAPGVAADRHTIRCIRRARPRTRRAPSERSMKPFFRPPRVS